MKYLLVLLFIIMVAAQWYVPISMIRDQEATIADGQVFKFKTRPVDPTDPFRGKYITLNFEADFFPVDSSDHWERHDDIFVSFKEDSLGFAKIDRVFREEPATTSAYVKAKVAYTPYESDNIYHLRIIYPFERFYLEESKAPKAELAHQQSQADSSKTTYAVVSIKNGRAALQDVRIDDKSVVEIVRETNSSN